MRPSKQNKLKKQGWVVGTAADFLGLSAEESAFIDLRLRLATLLKDLREKRNLKQDDVARLVRSSQSRVAKMESADPSVTVDLLVRTLIALGASNKQIGRAIAG